MRASTLHLRAGALLLAAALPAPAYPQAAGDRPATSTPSPAAKAAPPQQPAAPSKQPGTEAMVLGLKTVEGIMGKPVRAREGNEDMGRIVDVLVDDAGQVRAAVIDFGGFLGVGNRKVAVDWKTLDFADSIQSGSVKVSLTKDQVRQAPEYKADEPVVVLENNGTQKAAPSPSSVGHNETAPAH